MTTYTTSSISAALENLARQVREIDMVSAEDSALLEQVLGYTRDEGIRTLAATARRIADAIETL